MPRVPDCHPDRAHQARGLCSKCYFQQYDAKRKQRRDPRDYAPNYRKPPHPAARVNACGHPNREHHAHGMCRPCYMAQRTNQVLATCHPDQPHVANGLCARCVSKRRYDLDPDAARRLARASGIRQRQRLREELLSAYGGRCTCPKCPEANPAFLTLEHIGGTGKEHRARVGRHAYADLRRQGWPQEGYTLLCWNCNAATRHGKTCPHLE